MVSERYAHIDVQDAAISMTAAGSVTAVTGVAGKRIRLLGYALVMNGAGTAQWKSDTTAKSGVMSFAANGGVAPEAPLTCAEGESLVLTTATSFANGHIAYQVI